METLKTIRSRAQDLVNQIYKCMNRRAQDQIDKRLLGRLRESSESFVTPNKASRILMILVKGHGIDLKSFDSIEHKDTFDSIKHGILEKTACDTSSELHRLFCELLEVLESGFKFNVQKNLQSLKNFKDLLHGNTLYSDIVNAVPLTHSTSFLDEISFQLWEGINDVAPNEDLPSFVIAGLYGNSFRYLGHAQTVQRHARESYPILERFLKGVNYSRQKRFVIVQIVWRFLMSYFAEALETWNWREEVGNNEDTLGLFRIIRRYEHAVDGLATLRKCYELGLFLCKEEIEGAWTAQVAKAYNDSLILDDELDQILPSAGRSTTLVQRIRHQLYVFNIDCGQLPKDWLTKAYDQLEDARRKAIEIHHTDAEGQATLYMLKILELAFRLGIAPQNYFRYKMMTMIGLFDETRKKLSSFKFAYSRIKTELHHQYAVLANSLSLDSFPISLNLLNS